MIAAALRIGDLANQLNIPRETIRYYEREGLLPAPQRTEGNYRLYDPVLAERLAFIRNCRAFDMTLDEIRELLRLRDTPELECGAVNQLLDDHIGHVTERISQLKRLRLNLQSLRDRCAESTQTGNCEILNGLTKDADHVAGPASHISMHVRKREVVQPRRKAVQRP
jgi:Cd(II)/Pb(II)-responsive transcriptional regulator